MKPKKIVAAAILAAGLTVIIAIIVFTDGWQAAVAVSLGIVFAIAIALVIAWALTVIVED